MMKALLFAACLLAAASAHAAAQEFPDAGVRVETIAEGLEIPWEVAFAPDGRMFLTERTGSLRVVQDGGLVPEPVISLDVSRGEGGLLGLALDPGFGDNGHLYLYYSYAGPDGTYNRIVRYTERDNTLHDETIILDGIPGSARHDGGRIKFGPDGRLYATTGDAVRPGLAQDHGSLAGKILRINPDGSIPEDNPYNSSAVFSMGHRNPQGLDWHPYSGVLVATDHGPSGERGAAHDEVNVVHAGSNHGWPHVIGDETSDGMTGPIVHTGHDTWAPSGTAFYDSYHVGDWHGMYAVATLRGEHLRLLDLDLEGGGVLDSVELFAGEFGRLRNAAMGPDGHLYVMTSNRDGRGDPAANDDRILRIVPIEPAQRGDPSMSPLKQIQSGTLPHNVSCRAGLDLVERSGGRHTQVACVTGASAERLVQIGWARTAWD